MRDGWFVFVYFDYNHYHHLSSCHVSINDYNDNIVIRALIIITNIINQEYERYIKKS